MSRDLLREAWAKINQDGYYWPESEEIWDTLVAEFGRGRVHVLCGVPIAHYQLADGSRVCDECLRRSIFCKYDIAESFTHATGQVMTCHYCAYEFEQMMMRDWGE